MPSKLLIRDVPSEVHGWLKEQSHERRITQNEFSLTILRDARRSNGTLSLFDQPVVQQAEPESAPFSFIDLFAGIGGMRLALEAVGGRCKFSSEWDENCQRTYLKWFGEKPTGDITRVKPADIPDHDVLAAGFPCQPFSIAGVSKKKSLGRAHGFKDKAQGTLFFQLATIIELKRPPILLLENVKNLKSHDGGKTWEVIQGTLRDLKYTVFSEVIDAAAWVPQHRERIFIVGFNQHVFSERPPFEFPKRPTSPSPVFRSVLGPSPDPKYTLSPHLWKYLQDYAKKHRQAGNGFGFGLVDLDGVSRTLSARYFKDGSEILIPQSGRNPRRLTPREAARLMGFDDGLPIVVSDTQAYRQFGNAVVPPVAKAVAKQIMKVVHWQVLQNGKGCLLKPDAPPMKGKKRLRSVA
ncbi:MAG: DNA (cytosine-5-)-methyltransferase [Candidatus Eisenbacteria bacterium]|nr:DNA (cytosine-5-)-methyltransferase [Candidatus Eisenbacteria bacterium]